MRRHASYDARDINAGQWSWPRTTAGRVGQGDTDSSVTWSTIVRNAIASTLCINSLFAVFTVLSVFTVTTVYRYGGECVCVHCVRCVHCVSLQGTMFRNQNDEACLRRSNSGKQYTNRRLTNHKPPH